ncbi:PREDICTED: nuclear transcription factor Y subunit gamma-like isoform X2 [Papilio xuthus]|uniref:Nuclear transcription factor Y subunit gamma n=1 Tax=Papilio xuthus TaxID=66420 RepID=A0AAJ6YZB1_PAPXU|nr:PREDICTED: nuclear transcription factor Y subunit gamma-like isoform X2 [Papilio xuthus]
MSVCFFVPADQAGTSAVSEEGDTEAAVEEGSSPESIQHSLQVFWAKVTEDIKKVTADDFKTQALPLARIKKIMKLDEEVKMISAEAPVLFAKAAEIFIHELTLRAWYHTEENKRRTLQRNDIATAISKSDQLDFLIDIVPRQEVKVTKPREDPPRTNNTDQYYLQLAQQHQAALQGTQPQYVLQPCAQVVQSGNAATTSGGGQQPLTLVQQVVTSSGELQQVPIQLSQAQLNIVRPQLQNNQGQLIVIQAQPQQTPQIIQVSSHAGQNQPQQVFLAQVATTQEES